MKKLLALVLVLAVAGLGWFLLRGDRAPSAGQDLLAYIPADTPFVITALEPLPRDVAEQTMAASAGMVEAYRQIFADLRGKIEAEGADKPETQKALAVFDALDAEFSGKTPQQAMEHLGFSMQGRSAFYGLGLVPVLRIELGDAPKLEAFIDRMEAVVGAELVEHTLDAHRYWTLPQTEIEVQPAMAIIDGQLILSAIPGTDDEAALRRVFGLERPARSMADDDRLQRLAQELDLAPYAVGYIETQALIDAFVRGDDALKASFLKALDVPAPEMDAACTADAARIATAWPRISLGLTRFDKQGSSVLTVIHTDPAIAGELKKLRAPMPGGASEQDDPLLDVGFSLSLNSLPGVVTALANRITATPFACPALAGLNKAADQAKLGINQPMLFAAAPVFSGLRVSIDAVSLDAATMQPTFTGTTVIASDNPDSLIGMARSTLPGLANLQLDDAGTVVALPAMPGAPPGLTAHAARRDKLVGLAVGDDAAAILPARMQIDAAFQPVLQIGAGADLYTVIADGIDRVVETMPAGDKRDELALQAKIMRASYAQTFKGSMFRLEITDRGIEIVQDTEFAVP